jgi:putative MATE family efflux protein
MPDVGLNKSILRREMFKKVFQTLWRAIKGEDIDFTAISVKKAVIFLAIPMVIEMFMESLFAIVDVFFVGKLGTEAVTTIGFTESLLTIVYSLGFGVSMGATAIVARRIGEKNIPAASKAAGQTIFVGILVSLCITIVGIFFSGDLLRLMGGDENLVAYGKNYTFWMLTGNFTILLLFLLNGVFRGAGNASIAMRALWISNGLNIILDPLMIFGIGSFDGYGLDGAAYATNIGRGIGVLYQLYILFNGKSIVKCTVDLLKPKADLIRKIINVSAGGTGQFIISSASWIFLMRIIAHFGNEATAGYTIAIRVLIFTILPAWGLANAAATLVGQNLGAKQPDRAEQSVKVASWFNVAFLGAVSIIYFFLAESIIQFFSEDAAVIANGVECLKYLAFGYVFFAFGMVMTQAFNGAGDTKTPTLLNLVAFWLMQIPLSYVLAITLDLGPKGVYLGIIISETFLALAALYLFSLGRWKKKEL